jgi:hypothetical protein
MFSRAFGVVSSQDRCGAHRAGGDHGEQFVRIGDAPHLRHVAELWCSEAGDAQCLEAFLGAAVEKEIGAGGKPDIHRPMLADGRVQRADGHGPLRDVDSSSHPAALEVAERLVRGHGCSPLEGGSGVIARG